MKIKIYNLFVLTIILNLQAELKNNFHDIYQLHNTNYPFSFMNQEYKNKLNSEKIKGISERFQFCVSTVAHTSTKGRNKYKQKVDLGNIHGNLGMIPLMYGSVPNGQTRAPLLTSATAINFPTWINPATGLTTTPSIATESLVDQKQNFGFFTVPLKYNKIGARFSSSLRIMNYFELSLHGGICDMKQTCTGLVDQTSKVANLDIFPDGSVTTVTSSTVKYVQANVMQNYKAIFTQMGINADNWQKTGAEDFSAYLTWRCNLPLNIHQDPEDWSQFVLIPHVKIGGTFATAPVRDEDVLFSLPLGNNGHNALHASGGFTLDFKDSIELSIDGGITKFMDRTATYRVPTSLYQSVLFPYKADMIVSPGSTIHMNIGMHAYHFLDKVSCFCLYTYASHKRDTATLTTPNSIFYANRWADDTAWKVQMAHVGFSYDLAPNLNFGLVWQMPITQRAAYKANTLQFSAVVTF